MFIVYWVNYIEVPNHLIYSQYFVLNYFFIKMLDLLL